MEVVEKILQDLHAGIESNDATVDFNALISSIEAIALGELDDSDLSQCSSLLFLSQSPPSLLQFMTATLRMKDRDIIRTKVYALKFLAAYVKKQYENIQSYCEAIAVELANVFKREESGEVKAALLLPFKNIIRRRISSPDDVSFAGNSADEEDPSSNTQAFSLESFPLESIYTTFIEEIKFNKKMSKGVHCELLKSLGLLVALYPSAAPTLASIEAILDLADGALKSAFNIKGKDPDFPAIAGAFSCLDRCLLHFEERYVNNVDLWKYLLQAANTSVQEDVSRYAAARKAIKLIKNHSELFINVIGMNAEKSYDIVHSAHGSGKDQLMKHSEGALQAVIASLATYLTRNIDKKGKLSSSTTAAAGMVNKLLASYVAVLKDPTSGPGSDAMALALQGLNAIAIAVPVTNTAYVSCSIPEIISTLIEVANHYSRFMSSNDVEEAAGDVVLAASTSMSYVVYRKSLFFCTIVSYVFTAFIRSSSNPQALQTLLSDKVLLTFLEEYGTEVLVGYVRLYSKQQRFIKSAMTKLFSLHVLMADMPGEMEFDACIMNLFHMAMLRTMSRAEGNEKISPDLLTLSQYNIYSLEDRLVYIYTSLWHAILAPVDKIYTILLVEHVGLQAMNIMKKEMLSFLLAKSIAMMGQLQLAYIASEEGSGTTYMPMNLVDQDLFINLIAFLEVILTHFDRQAIYEALPSVLDHVIALSAKHYLVSGFYRFITTLLSITEDILLVSILDNQLSAEHLTILSSLKEYILAIQSNILSSPTDYTGELLASIIKMILTVPIELIRIDSITPTLYCSLSNNIYINLSIAMMTKYFIHNKQQFVAHALHLLPLLDQYIVTAGEAVTTTTNISSASGSVKVKSRRARTVAVQANAAKGGAKLSQEILIFLGRLGQYNKHILPSPQESIQKSLKWSLTAELPLRIHLTHSGLANAPGGGGLQVMLEGLLPVIADIAIRSVDMNSLTNKSNINSISTIKLISSAAETLYNIIVLMIGNNSLQQHRANPKYAYQDLYAKLLPAIFVLASSGSTAYALIFQKLLNQIIHYFSNSKNNITEAENILLIDSLIVAISENNSNSIKEVCAAGLAEYIQYSISNNLTAGGAAVNITYIDNIMSNICILLSHPIESKRRAGVLILLKAYKFIRSELLLVKRYVMYILYLLIKLLESPSLSEVAGQEIASLCVKFEEMLVYYAIKHKDAAELHIFQEYRAFPRSLHELGDWLWQHILQLHDHKTFRRHVMRFFISISPLLFHNAAAAPAGGVADVYANNAASIHRVQQYLHNWANALNKATRGSNLDFLAHLNKTINSKLYKVLDYFQNLEPNRKADTDKLQVFTSALDVCNWLITMRLVTPKQIIQTYSANVHDDGQIINCLVLNISVHIINQVHAQRASLSSELEDAWYRLLIFVTNMVLYSAPHNKESIAFLKQSGIYSRVFVELVFESILFLSKVPQDDAFKAVKNMLHYLNDFEDQNNQALNAYIAGHTRKVLKNIFDLTTINSATFQDLHKSVLFVKLLKASSLDGVAFGTNSAAMSIKLIEKACDLLTAKKNKTSGDQDASKELILLALDLGLPLCDSKTPMYIDVASQSSQDLKVDLKDISLLGLLAHANIGPVLSKHYNAVLTQYILSAEHACSIYHSQNLRFLLDHLNNPRVQALLEQVLLQISDSMKGNNAALMEFLVMTMLPLLETVNYKQVSDALVTLLLSIFAQLTAIQNQLFTIASLRKHVIATCVQTFTSNSDAAVVLVRLKWLPYVLAGSSNSAPRPLALVQDSAADLERIQESLEELASRRFPLDSNQLSPSSDKGREYLLLLETYLQVLQQSGCTMLFMPLLPSLREGCKHIYTKLIMGTFQRVAANITINLVAANEEAVSPEAFSEVKYICNFCLELVYDIYQDLEIKKVFFEKLFLPTVTRLSSNELVLLFSLNSAQGLKINSVHNVATTAADQSIVKVLYDIIMMDVIPNNIEPELLSSHIYMQICAYKMFVLLYDNCYVKDIKSILTAAYVHNNMASQANISGKELTQNLCRVAFKFTRTNLTAIPNIHGLGIDLYNEETSASHAVLKDLFHELYGAAYCCLVVVVCKTQSEETFFDNFIFKAKPNEEMWTQIIQFKSNTVLTAIFTVLTPKFDTMQLSNSIYQNIYGSTSTATDSISKVNKLSILAKLGAGKGGFVSQYIHSTMLSNSQIYQGTVTDSAVIGDASRDQGEYSMSQYNYDNIPNLTAAAAMTDNTYNLGNIAAGNQAANLVTGWDDQVIYFELNDVNNIYIMSTLTRVIQRMYVLFKDKWNTNTHSLPNWLSELYNKLNSSMQNVSYNKLKLFILRLFMNQPVAAIIAPWIPIMLPAILENTINLLLNPATNAASSTEKKGFIYHYFLRDIVFTFCDSWAAVVVPFTCYNYCSSVLNYMLAAIADLAASKDESNAEQVAEVIKESTLSMCALLKLWINNAANQPIPLAPPTSPFIQLDLTPLVPMMTTSHSASGGSHARVSSLGSQAVRSRLAGLQIFMALLDLHYPMLFDGRYMSMSGSNTEALISKLLAAVLDGIKFPRKEVMELSCQAAGKLLHIIFTFKAINKLQFLHRDCEKYYENVYSNIESKLPLKDGLDQIIACLKNVTLFYSSFVKKDIVLKTILSFNILSSKTKCQYLETLLYYNSIYISDNNTSVAAHNSDNSLLYIDLLRPYLRSLLSDLTVFAFGRGSNIFRLPSIQLYTLMLLTKYVQALPTIHTSISNTSGTTNDKLCLDLLDSILGKSEAEGLRYCVSSKSILPIRFATYNLLVSVYKHREYVFKDSTGGVDENHAVLKAIVQMLLAGLNDPDGDVNQLSSAAVNLLDDINITSIKQYTTAAYWKSTERVFVKQLIYTFFHAHYGLSANIHNRMLLLFSKLFDIHNVSNWLQYSSYLLLSSVLECNNNSNMLFTHNLLENNQYNPLNTSSNAVTQQVLSNNTPMFALERTSQSIANMLSQPIAANGPSTVMGTILSQSSRVNLAKYTKGSAKGSFVNSYTSNNVVNYARGTQQVSWTQSQESSGSGSGGASAGNKVYNTFMENNTVNNNNFISSQYSSQGAEPAPSQASNTSNPAMPPPAPRYVTTQRVPMRFQSGKTADAARSSIINKMTYKRSIQRDEESKKNSFLVSNLQLYNSYRVGDMPDIAISNNSILKPLQALVLHDVGMAGKVVSVLVSALSDGIHDTADGLAFVTQLVQAINHILKQCQLHNKSNSIVSILISILFDLCKHAEYVNVMHALVNDNMVAELALHAGCLHTALQYLERKIFIINNVKFIGNGATPAPTAATDGAAKKKRGRGAGTAESAGSLPQSIGRHDSINELFDKMSGDSAIIPVIPVNIAMDSASINEINTTQIYIQLLRIYDRLQEDDILLSLSQHIHSSLMPADKAKGIKEALDAENRGDIMQAVDIYTNIINAYSANTAVVPTGGKRNYAAATGPPPGSNEYMEILLDRSIECYHKLANWQDLHGLVSGAFEGGRGGDDMGTVGVFNEGKKGEAVQKTLKQHLTAALSNDESSGWLKDRILPHYFRSLLHVTFDVNNLADAANMPERLTAFMASNTAKGLLSPIDLAAAHVHAKDFVKANLCIEEAYSAFIDKYNLLHPIAHNAKANLMLSLQRLNELQDIVLYNTQQQYIYQKLNVLNKIGGTNTMKSALEEDLMRMWKLSEPSILDPMPHHSDLMWARTLALHNIHGAAEVMEAEDDPGLSASAGKHVCNLVLRSAVAAVAQGKLSLVKQLLEQNNNLRKKVLGKKAAITLAEVQVVLHYNRTSILRQAAGQGTEIEAMLGRTQALLQHKQKLVDQQKITFERDGMDVDDGLSVSHINCLMEESELQILHSNWMRFWSAYDLSMANAGAAGTKAMESLQRSLNSAELLEQAVYGLKENDVRKGSNHGLHKRMQSLRSRAYDNLALISDELLRQAEASNDNNITNDWNDVVRTADNVFGGSGGSADAGKVQVLAHLTAQSLLRGLALQSQHCSERVLRLVQILAKYTASDETASNDGKSKRPKSKSPISQGICRSETKYTDQLLAVPAWLYLRYSAQLMGSLDLPEGRVIIHVMNYLAKTYPFALHYVYRITKENNSIIKSNAKYATLHRLLDNKDIDCLVESLVCLTHPELRYTDYIKVLDGLLKQYTSVLTKPTKGGSSLESLKEQVLATLEELYTYTLSQSWPTIGARIGKYNKHFAKSMQAKLQTVLGNSRSNIFNKGVIEKMKELGQAASGAMKHSSGKAGLAEFSEWLADFDSSNTRLELPGQYIQYTHSMPRPAEHDLLNSLLSTVTVMSSIRKPKKVSFVGHTGRVAAFLAKGGEDLRNDERIEQLFMLMNRIVGQDDTMHFDEDDGDGSRDLFDASSSVAPASVPAPTKPVVHDLSARTYGVIPMSTKVGLLEWVPNTVPLQCILSEEMAKDAFITKNNAAACHGDGTVQLSALEGATIRQRWLRSNDVTDYHKMYRNANCTQACEVYAAISSSLPQYFLQQRLLALSSTAEAFHTLRNTFLRSLAVNNVFAYILGIGDRHLDNLLLDTSTGMVVFIDFGICFGMGASVLPVPEFMPMRLTAQVLGVAQPLNGLQLIRQYMLQAMHKLRRDQSNSAVQFGDDDVEQTAAGYSGLLGNALEVYINDPVMDWLKGAASAMDRDFLLQQREQLLNNSEEIGSAPLPSQTSSLLWEPMRRIQGALRKLRGEDPVLLLLEDLQNNQFVGKMKTYPCLEGILNESRRLVPAKVKEKKSKRQEKVLSEEDQVDLLLAMATDPNILVRQWVGLQPWL